MTNYEWYGARSFSAYYCALHQIRGASYIFFPQLSAESNSKWFTLIYDCDFRVTFAFGVSFLPLSLIRPLAFLMIKQNVKKSWIHGFKEEKRRVAKQSKCLKQNEQNIQTHVLQSERANTTHSFFSVLSEFFFSFWIFLIKRADSLVVQVLVGTLFCVYANDIKAFKRPNLTEAQPMERMLLNIARSHGTVTTMTLTTSKSVGTKEKRKSFERVQNAYNTHTHTHKSGILCKQKLAYQNGW